MKNVLRTFLKSTEVSGLNPEESRRRKLINILLLTIAAGAVLVLATLLVALSLGKVGGEREIKLLIFAISSYLTGAGVIYFINRYFSVYLAGTLLLLLIIVIASVSDLPREVVGGRGLLLFAIPILAASFILSPRASFVAAAVCSAAIISIGLLADPQILPSIAAVMGFFILALFSYLSAKSLRDIHRDILESENKHRMFFENASVGIGISDPSGNMLYINERMTEITGYTPRNFSKTNVIDTYVNPADRKRLLETIDREGEADNFEAQLKRENGEIYWASLFVKPIEYDEATAFLTSIIDVTERKKTERLLLEKDYQIQALYEAPEIFMGILDIDGKLLSANNSALDFIGKTFSEIEGRYFWETPWWNHSEKLQKRLKESIEKAGRGISDRFEAKHIGKNGEIVFIDFSLRPTKDEKGNIFKLFAEGIDITEKIISEERRKLHSDILRTLNRANQWKDLINDILDLIKTDFDAVGIRLIEGEDYPYYVTNGFSNEFVKKERRLCSIGPDGEIERDSEGNAILECMCGTVIRGRTDPSQEFFTDRGSFWTNSTTELLSGTTGEDRQGRTRNRCAREGYESVALIPIRVGKETIGLLQLNDRRKNRFTAELVEFFENIGNSLGVAVRRKQIEEELTRRERLHEEAQKVARIGHWELNPGFDAMNWSGEIFRILGLNPDKGEPTFAEHEKYIHSEDWPALKKALTAAADEGTPFNLVARAIRPGGEIRWINMIGMAKRDEDGNVSGLFGTVQDVTDLKRTEQDLVDSRESYRKIFSTAANLIISLDSSGIIVNCNDQIENLLGYRKDEIIGNPMLEIIHPDDVERAKDSLAEIQKTGYSYDEEYRIVRKDGGVIDVIVNSSGINPEGDSYKNTICIINNITSRKKTESALRESERKLSTLIGNLQGMAYRCRNTPGWTMEFVSDGCLELTGYEPEEILKNSLISYEEIIHPEDRMMVREAVDEALEKGKHFELQYRIITRERKVKWVWEKGKLIRSDEGKPEIIEGFISDISSRKNAEEKLKESELQKKVILNASAEMVVYYDTNLRVIWANRVSAESVGETPEALEGRHCYEIWHNRNQPCNDCPVLKARDTKTPHKAVQNTPDGRHFFVRGYPVLDENKEVTALVEFGQDITEKINREKEQEKMLEELNRARKMESIGQLAGGVAHDFNNLLTVINGHADLLLNNDKLSETSRQGAREISEAGKRAAELTSQLLAFSRRQILEPEVINLNNVIANLKNMLTRLIGEDIELITELDDNLPNVKADPGQMEQVIVNIVVNAREAMPEGGRLTVTTGKVELNEESLPDHTSIEPGRYVEVSISDTGFGMDEQTREQIFEPFFTTRGMAKGTGLGLSTVHGIVNQSGGAISVDSEQGSGTTFNIYLPVVNEPVKPKRDEKQKSGDYSGTEAILVVEDDRRVLSTICQMLESRGYKILKALSPEKALKIFRENRDSLQLVLTDVVMPEMDGKELAGKILSLNPDIKVLFMSGYTDDAIAPRGVPKSNIVFLRKPFTPDQLAGKVREVLDDKGKV
ncbi:MAG: PAS domain S-box protein [Candidatus Krumholzibacteriota bacterium]|nr:PAS domain S-box protein [Candidatus Krumholzibacteriota bacterium]